MRVLKESNKSRFDIASVRKSVLIISHNIFRDFHVHIFCRTTFLEIAVYRVFGLVVAVTSTIVTLIQVSKQHDFNWMHYRVLFIKG